VSLDFREVKFNRIAAATAGAVSLGLLLIKCTGRFVLPLRERKHTSIKERLKYCVVSAIHPIPFTTQLSACRDLWSGHQLLQLQPEACAYGSTVCNTAVGVCLWRPAHPPPPLACSAAGFQCCATACCCFDWWSFSCSWRLHLGSIVSSAECFLLALVAAACCTGWTRWNPGLLPSVMYPIH